jgi:hypothetical protein
MVVPVIVGWRLRELWDYEVSNENIGAGHGATAAAPVLMQEDAAPAAGG